VGHKAEKETVGNKAEKACKNPGLLLHNVGGRRRRSLCHFYYVHLCCINLKGRRSMRQQCTDGRIILKRVIFHVFLTVLLSINLAITNLTHNIFILYYVYYIPPHISSSNMLIIRRLNRINTASGTVILCRWLVSAQVARVVRQVGYY
jgi:hypothetical protein